MDSCCTQLVTKKIITKANNDEHTRSLITEFSLDTSSTVKFVIAHLY
jgi:hypothetical protein